jgi:hypothetical protein
MTVIKEILKSKGVGAGYGIELTRKWSRDSARNGMPITKMSAETGMPEDVPRRRLLLLRCLPEQRFLNVTKGDVTFAGGR